MNFIIHIYDKAEHEKAAAIIRAQGEAHAAKVLSDAIERAGPGIVELRQIEAAREIAQNLSSSKNVTYVPGGQSIFYNLPHQ